MSMMTPRRAGLVALVVGLAITGTVAALHGWARLIDYDSRYFRSVATDLDASQARGSGLVYRYGRIALPVIARLMAFGEVHRLDITLTLVTPLAFAAVVAGAVAVARAAGRPPWAGLVVLAVPGIWYSFAYALSDVLLAACAVAAVWATLARRGGVAVAAIALEALTKEVGALCALPCALAAWHAGDRRGDRGAARSSRPAPPLVGVGVPPGRRAAPARGRPGSSDSHLPPLLAIVRALTGGPGDPVAALLALLVGVAGLVVLAKAPGSPLAWHGAAWALLTLCLGTNVLRYPPDAIRVMTPAMCVVGLSLLLLDWRPSMATSPPTPVSDGSLDR